MQARIERIGDGFGLLLPKELIEACGFGGEATVTVQDKELLVTPAQPRVREGWAEAARVMRERGEDFTPELQEWERLTEEWDEKEWHWPGLESDEKV